MTAPAGLHHIPMAFLNAIWDEFDKVTWAPDARPMKIRMLYHTAVSNAVKRYYEAPAQAPSDHAVGKDEGAIRHDDLSTPSIAGVDNE